MLKVHPYLLIRRDTGVALSAGDVQGSTNLLKIEFATASHAKHYTSLFVRPAGQVAEKGALGFAYEELCIRFGCGNYSGDLWIQALPDRDRIP